MTPVMQTIFHDPPTSVGNCMAACVASILDLPIDDVPHFAAMDDTWWDQFIEFAWDQERQVAIHDEPLTKVGMMLGRSPRGDFTHVVVADGAEMIHDPHPDGTGVSSPFQWWYLLDVEES